MSKAYPLTNHVLHRGGSAASWWNHLALRSRTVAESHRSGLSRRLGVSLHPSNEYIEKAKDDCKTYASTITYIGAWAENYWIDFDVRNGEPLFTMPDGREVTVPLLILRDHYTDQQADRALEDFYHYHRKARGATSSKGTGSE